MLLSIISGLLRIISTLLAFFLIGPIVFLIIGLLGDKYGNKYETLIDLLDEIWN